MVKVILNKDVYKVGEIAVVTVKDLRVAPFKFRIVNDKMGVVYQVTFRSIPYHGQLSYRFTVNRDMIGENTFYVQRPVGFLEYENLATAKFKVIPKNTNNKLKLGDILAIAVLSIGIGATIYGIFVATTPTSTPKPTD
jgi:hypothetical protein